MKEYPVGHAFYKNKGLKHVEGKIPEKYRLLYEKLAKKRFNGSMVAAISWWLVKHPPKG